MKKITNLLVVMSLLVFIACKKDSKKDCDINNYGTIKINFAHSDNVYWMSLNNRIKVESTTMASDTFHAGPGSYTVGILNKATSNSTTQVVNVQTCKETTVNSTN